MFINDAISRTSEHPLCLSIDAADARDWVGKDEAVLLGKHQFIRNGDVSTRFALMHRFHHIDRITRRMVGFSFRQLPLTTFDSPIVFVWVCPQVDTFLLSHPFRLVNLHKTSRNFQLIENAALEASNLLAIGSDIANVLVNLPALKKLTLIWSTTLRTHQPAMKRQNSADGFSDDMQQYREPTTLQAVDLRTRTLLRAKRIQVYAAHRSGGLTLNRYPESLLL
ncbi:hypothetical protein CGCFRS4_v015442 [Colletotrichum fructicola]|nr:hypothetical protein CGCFRS4_v015442 [Colletotrichum fructicola]